GREVPGQVHQARRAHLVRQHRDDGRDVREAVRRHHLVHVRAGPLVGLEVRGGGHLDPVAGRGGRSLDAEEVRRVRQGAVVAGEQRLAAGLQLEGRVVVAAGGEGGGGEQGGGRGSHGRSRVHRSRAAA